MLWRFALIRKDIILQKPRGSKIMSLHFRYRSTHDANLLISPQIVNDNQKFLYQ